MAMGGRAFLQVSGGAPKSRNGLVLNHDLLTFIGGSIRSVWALELLLLLRKHAPAALTPEAIAKELRASPNLVSACAGQLQAAGIVACEPGGCRFSPAAPVIETLCAELEQAYRERPVAVINAIAASPNDRLQTFADAFRFKDKEKDK